VENIYNFVFCVFIRFFRIIAPSKKTDLFYIQLLKRWYSMLWKGEKITGLEWNGSSTKHLFKVTHVFSLFIGTSFVLTEHMIYV
jgi:hypothetical protein